MKYIFYICNPDMSVETEELNCETALDALYFAASNFFDLRTANLDDAEEVEEEKENIDFDTKVGCAEYLDEADVTEGIPFYIAIKDENNNFIYGNEEIVQSFEGKLDEAFDDDELNEEMLDDIE